MFPDVLSPLLAACVLTPPDGPPDVAAVVAELLSDPAASEADTLDQVLYLFEAPGPVPPPPPFAPPLAPPPDDRVRVRPATPFSPSPAGRGWVDVGYSHLRDGEFSEHLAPDLGVRLLVTDWLELRGGWGGVSFAEVDGERLDDDAAEPNLGLTAFLWDARGGRPAVALSASLPIATDANPFAAENLLPVAEVLYGWDVGERWRLTGRTGLALVREVDEAGSDLGATYDLRQGAAVDYFVPAASPVLPDAALFAGWSALLPAGDGDAEHVAELGFQTPLPTRWRWADGWRWDVRAAAGLSEAAPDLILGTGLSVPF